MEKSKILVISGPTASGKSELALKVAEQKDAVIINADSLQIFEGLPILSSQPTKEDKLKVKHLLYSHLKPEEYSSVGIWMDLVKSAVESVLKEGKLPIIVGGSGMYISKLIDGISIIPEITEEVRNAARDLFDEIGLAEMQKKLIALGEDEILDKHRLIRAYEVLEQTGESISWWQDKPLKKILPEANFIHVNLNPDREKLYERCNTRFWKMIDNGALEEVKNLVETGISDEKQITKTLGYYAIHDLLKGEINRGKMVESSSQKTRNYAKRQLTWFRNQLPEKYVFSENEAALKFCKNEI